MTSSLENRSLLRKLDFPQNCQEALSRLYETFSTFAGVSSTISISPKETEFILETIDEFVFLNKPTKSRKSNVTQNQMSNLQELHLMQIVLDFFLSRSTSDKETLPLSNLFSYLFMDPPGDVQGSSRTNSLIKFSILALGLKCQPVLNCLGQWLQNAPQEKSRTLVKALVNNYILMIPDNPGESLKTIPLVSPLFSAHFVSLITDIYSPLEKPIPRVLLELFSIWLEHANKDKMLPIKGFMIQIGTQPISFNNPGLTPLVGLAKWGILGPILTAENDKENGQIYQKIHCVVLECITEACDHKAFILKPDLIPTARLVGLVECVQSGTEKTSGQLVIQECFDRLGQFLLSIQATRLFHGKISEVASAINKVPFYKANGHRLLKIFVQKSK